MQNIHMYYATTRTLDLVWSVVWFHQGFLQQTHFQVCSIQHVFSKQRNQFLGKIPCCLRWDIIDISNLPNLCNYFIVKNVSREIEFLPCLAVSDCLFANTWTCYLLLQSSGSPDPKLYIWDVELDTVQYFNFESGRGEQDEYMAQEGEMDSDASDADKSVSFSHLTN